MKNLHVFASRSTAKQSTVNNKLDISMGLLRTQKRALYRGEHAPRTPALAGGARDDISVSRYKICITILAVFCALALVSCGTNAFQTTPTLPLEKATSQITMTQKPEATVIPTTTSTPQANPTPTGWWRPQPGLTWQWHISEPPVDTSVNAQVFDIDLFENDAAVVAGLQAQGRKVICYISVGSREDWRPDKDQFPPEVLGKDYDGWPGEKWLDIRQIDKLAPIMRARFDLCKAKGFDAIEPDNMEIYDNETGFPLTYDDQIRYARWLADEAHQRGLAIGMKNASDSIKDLLPSFDFAITEDCFDQGWCGEMLPFIQAGKPVFAAEYDDTAVDFQAACRKAKEMGFSVILKHRILTAFRVTCP